MHEQNVFPTIPFDQFKRTKMIATVGPATNTSEAIHELIAAGVNGLRLNFSHGTHEERLEQIPWIRQASQALGKPVAIIQDLQGPKVRLGDFVETIEVKAGQIITLQYGADYAATGVIPTQYDLATKIKPGERLYLFDGRVRTTVTSVDGDMVHATVHNDGVLMKRKGLNLPDTDFNGDILTEKDLADIRFGAEQDIDYVALSFVQSADDVENLRRVLHSLGSSAKIIAKIETRAAVDAIESIVQVSDVLMVARGDLAMETAPELVPVVQRRIIELGRTYAKPVIVATQMMASMVDHPEPTRAEVSDVATAVFLGADCVMLSDETANGKYPLETVKTMKRIVCYAEQNPMGDGVSEYRGTEDLPYAIASSVHALARTMRAKAIVAEADSGEALQRLAALRPSAPLLAITADSRLGQQLTLVYGVKSYIQPTHEDAAVQLANWLHEHNCLRPGDATVYLSGDGAMSTIRARVW